MENKTDTEYYRDLIKKLDRIKEECKEVLKELEIYMKGEHENA